MTSWDNRRDELKQLRSHVHQLEHTISDKDEGIAQEHLNIERKDVWIQQSQEIAETKETELQQNHKKLQNSFQLVQQYHQPMQQRDRTINSIHQTVAVCEGRIQQLEKQESGHSLQYQQQILAGIGGGPTAAKTLAPAAVSIDTSTGMPVPPPNLKWQLGSRAPEKMAAGTAVVHDNNPSGSIKVQQIKTTPCLWQPTHTLHSA